MDFNQLRLVLQIAAHGSLTRAAIALGMEQSVISRQLSGLETEYGGRLFHRTGRGMALTEFGAEILPRLQWLVEQADRIDAEIKAEAGVPSGDVRLGLLPAFSYPLVNLLFRDIRERHPRISLHFYEGSNGQLHQWVASGAVDIALLYRYDSADQPAERVLGHSDACLICPADGPLGGQPTITLRELDGVPLVLPSAPNPLRVALDEAAKRHGIRLSVVVEADSLPIQKNLVAAGEACAVLGALAINQEEAAGTLRWSRIVDPVIRRTAVLATSTQRPFTLAMRTVLQAVEARIGALMEPAAD